MGNVVVDTGILTPIPAATLLGYQAENSATNLCLQSQTFDNAGWSTTAGSVVITPNTQTAPDGTLTADTLADNATNVSHQLQQTVSVVSGSTYTASVYVKAGTLSWFQLSAYDGTARWANINLATGAVGFSGGVSTSVVALPNGWYRIGMTWTALGVSSFIAIIPLQSNLNVNGPAYVGTGQTMYLWGAQVEQSANSSSYIPTTTVAVIRNIDQLEYPTATNIGSSVGTIYSEAYLPPWTAASRILFRWDAADVLQYIAGGQLSYITPAFGGPIQTLNSFVPNTVNKCATGYGGSTGVGCMNGGTTINGAFVATLPAATNFRLGGGAGENAQGSIRNVKVYATRLTDAEIIALTGP